MKVGKTIEQLAAEIQRQQDSKRDFVAPTNKLHYLGESNILLVGNDQFSVDDNAHAQVADRLKVPKRYYDRMRLEAPELLAQNVNHWLHTGDDKRMVRTMDGKVRAFLSDKYRPLDNFELVQNIFPMMANSRAQLRSAEITDKRLYIKATFPELRGLVANPKQVNDIVEVGVVVSNSEIGHGSLKIEPMIYRLVCTNGMIKGASMRKNHVGGRHDADSEIAELLTDETRAINDKAFWMKVRDVMSSTASMEFLQDEIRKWEAATRNEISAPVEDVIRDVTEQYAIREGDRPNILANLVKGGDLSQFGLAQAITATANDHADYEQATNLEMAGGKIIELNQREWSSLAVA